MAACVCMQPMVRECAFTGPPDIAITHCFVQTFGREVSVPTHRYQESLPPVRDSVSTAALPTQGPPLPHVPRLIAHLFELLWSLCCRRLWPHCVFPSLLGPLNLFLQTLACSLARSLGAPHHRERKRAPVCKQALVSSVDAQGAERFNVYGPVKSVRPLKGPPALDCVRMCSWRARVCMRMHVLWSVQLRIACAGTAPQVRGHYDDWYVRYKAADGSQVRNGTGCCAEQAIHGPSRHPHSGRG